MCLHTLTKIRRATKSRDGHEGFLFVHQWPTGFQELVFETEALASNFLNHLNKHTPPPAAIAEDQPS